MKKYFLTICIFFICAMNLFSQQNTLYFSVSHRIITSSDSTAPMQSASMITDIMNELNKAFAPLGYSFILQGVTNSFIF